MAMGMALRKGDLDTLNFVNGRTAARRADGFFADRRRYWVEPHAWTEMVTTDPVLATACFE